MSNNSTAVPKTSPNGRNFQVHESSRPCPHCGPGLDFFTPELIALRLKEIPIVPTLAAEEKVFNYRLEKCSMCDALREKVLCSFCGCFVMFRARPEKSCCPHPEGDKWSEHQYNAIDF